MTSPTQGASGGVLRRAPLSECPICHVSMMDRDPYGHSLVHFPTDPLPTRPETLGARKAQAELLGKTIPEE